MTEGSNTAADSLRNMHPSHWKIRRASTRDCRLHCTPAVCWCTHQTCCPSCASMDDVTKTTVCRGPRTWTRSFLRSGVISPCARVYRPLRHGDSAMLLLWAQRLLCGPRRHLRRAVSRRHPLVLVGLGCLSSFLQLLFDGGLREMGLCCRFAVLGGLMGRSFKLLRRMSTVRRTWCGGDLWCGSA